MSGATGGNASKTTLRERKNWYIHLCFIRKVYQIVKAINFDEYLCLEFQDYAECLKVIEEQLKACNGQCEYPLYIKGISRLVVYLIPILLDALSINIAITRSCGRVPYYISSCCMFEPSQYQ